MHLAERAKLIWDTPSKKRNKNIILNLRGLLLINDRSRKCVLELTLKRLLIRPQAEQEAETELKAAYKDIFSRDTFKDSIRLTDNELHEDLYSEHSSIIRKLKAYKQQQQEQTYPKPKQHSHDDEELEL